MSLKEKYQQEYVKYNQLPRNAESKVERAKAMNTLRAMERDAAKAGEVLNPVIDQGRFRVDVTETDTKRSLQEEYVRKFNDKIPVEIENRRTGTKFRGTLQQYHRERLLKK